MRLKLIIILILWGLFALAYNSQVRAQVPEQDQAQPAHVFPFLELSGSQYSITNSISSKSTARRLGWGLGVGFDFPVSDNWSFESAVQFQKRRTGLGRLTLSVPFIYVPMVMRVWLNPYLSLGAGGYFAFGVGNVLSDADGVIISDISFGNSAFKKEDFGLVGSVKVSFPLAPETSLFVDGRFAYGLQNAQRQAQPGESFHWNLLTALSGVSFEL